jgi:hypothetical protein
MATETCISRAFTLLRKPLAKALHMGVTLDYAAFKAILISITRREPAILAIMGVCQTVARAAAGIAQEEPVYCGLYLKRTVHLWKY